MPKRRSDGRGDGCSAKRRRQHLYLVFDDWKWGHSVRKVDLSSDTDSGGALLQMPRAIFRMEAQHEYSQYITAGFGSKIIPMPVKRSAMPPNTDGSGSLHFFDVRQRCLTLGPLPMVDLVNPICIPIGDKLFVLSSDFFQVLHPPSADEPDSSCREGSWCTLPLQPFHGDQITSYAVHPDGRTIFVSAKKFATSTLTTYTFDTAEPCSEWKKQGDWALPFTGRAHFDPNLKAWVGIRGDLNSIRYICACDVVSAKSDDGGGICPSWKVSKETLFSEDPGEMHIGANLVFMGSNKFCLVESISIDNGDSRPPCLSECCQFRVVTFSLEYDKNGDLTTANNHRVRYYQVPETALGYSLLEPVAFWL